MVLASIATLSMPWIVKHLLKETLTTKNISALNIIIAISIAVIVILCISQYFHKYILNFISQKIIYKLRNDLFRHLIYLPAKFHANKDYTNLLSRITNDMLLLQQFLTGGLTSLLKEPIVLAGGLILIFYLHWKLAILSIFTGPLIIFSIIKFGKSIKKITLNMQERLASLVGVIQESLANIRLVKAFNREDFQNKIFEQKNSGYLNMYMKGIKLLTASSPITEFLSTLGVVAIIWYGRFEVINGKLTPPDLVAFILYLGTISLPLKNLTQVNMLLQQAKAASLRIFEILDEPIYKVNYKGKQLKIKGKIEFKAISFRYDTTGFVLKDINFQVNPSEVVVIVGVSGSGKTTLANLLLRLYEPTQGKILIDDEDIKDIDLKVLRNSISIVPQEVFLFSGSIRDNIRYGNLEASDSMVEEAAILANCDEFINRLPQGLDTNIGKMGDRLSAGQRQRIAIARAILKKPKILILDEATSNLDPQSERLVKSALKKIMQNQTTIFITHKLETAIKADKVIVLDKGRIVEIGKHQDLINKKGGIYSKLWESAR
jgi:subfamily B ATP-binding cassette protein MsbA